MDDLKGRPLDGREERDVFLDPWTYDTSYDILNYIIGRLGGKESTMLFSCLKIPYSRIRISSGSRVLPLSSNSRLSMRGTAWMHK
jgi:hypothetical protein